MTGDISEAEDILKFQMMMNMQLADVVLSDVAPELSGDTTFDSFHVERLNSYVLGMANRILRPGGNLFMKTFYSGEEQGQFKFMELMFKEAYRVKPNASRKRSSEVYHLGKVSSHHRKGISNDGIFQKNQRIRRKESYF